MNQVGIGYDVHQFKEGRPLFLGGVEIPHSRGLDGHSDADALIHAVCDAVFGAIGEPDIGHFFPNDDPEWKDKPSRVFLERAALEVVRKKGKIINIDSTVIAEEPKISAYIQKMREAMAHALAMNPSKITVKATTNERMGFVGRGEGIAAMAVASVELPE
ncbi:MAG TPA: 2-C-methyl-D-erythritol 2,4-cyclodiphosphate synthase [Verrucomicrobiales bacterium]|nr:2-C-methyl-D-erythritol 2,4-cyclodiphosphate synthase [Verrucomicrobiales bacterium]